MPTPNQVSRGGLRYDLPLAWELEEEAEAEARAMDWEEEEEEEEEEADADAVAVAGVKVKAEAEAVAVGELPYANRAPRQRNLSLGRQERTWLTAWLWTWRFWCTVGSGGRGQLQGHRKIAERARTQDNARLAAAARPVDAGS